jgi:hypothetical protein
VGPPKTGTSAIQSVLRDHDNSVVIYPKTGLFGVGGHANLVWTFFQLKRTAARTFDLGRLLAEFASATKGNSLDVVVSSETLTEPFGSCRDVGSFVSALTACVGEPLRVELLLTCREHFSWAASVYAQRVKGFRFSERRNPDEFLHDFASKLLYAPLIHALRKSGLELSVLSYHPSHDWVVRFLSHLGFPRNSVPTTEIKNISLSPKALIARYAANQVLQKDKQREFLRSLKTMPNFSASAQFIFGREAAAHADSLFGADREFLTDEFGIQLPVPDWNTQESKFFLDADGLADIAAITGRWGQEGRAIEEIAREYLRI